MDESFARYLLQAKVMGFNDVVPASTLQGSNPRTVRARREARTSPVSDSQRETVPMKKIIVLSLAVVLSGCGDFVDSEGNTSIRQFAEGLQSLGDRVSEMGEALERDADVRSVPWDELMDALPDEVDGAERLALEGDHATDRNGAGLSIAKVEYAVGNDTMFVGITDLGALRSGVNLALRWVAPLFAEGSIDGDVEETEIRGYPAIRMHGDDDEGHLVVLIVEGRFAVIVGSDGSRNEDFIRSALAEVDYRRLERWETYGR